jgi:hypothetical protein
MTKDGAKGILFLMMIIGFLWWANHRDRPEDILKNAEINKAATISIPPTNPDYSSLSNLPYSTSKHKFGGYDCTEDCSGHEAGYGWASKNFITDTSDCDEAGERYNSPSFAEGCRTYIEGGKYEDAIPDQDDNPVQDQDPPE